MTERHYPAPADRGQLTEQDLAIATLLGRYAERREHGAAPGVYDLLAVAAEFGDAAVDKLRRVLAFYEAMRARESCSTTEASRDPCGSAGSAAARGSCRGDRLRRDEDLVGVPGQGLALIRRSSERPRGVYPAIRGKVLKPQDLLNNRAGLGGAD